MSDRSSVHSYQIYAQTWPSDWSSRRLDVTPLLSMDNPAHAENSQSAEHQFLCGLVRRRTKIALLKNWTTSYWVRDSMLDKNVYQSRGCDLKKFGLAMALAIPLISFVSAEMSLAAAADVCVRRTASP